MDYESKYLELLNQNKALIANQNELILTIAKLNQTILELNHTNAALLQTIEELKNDKNDHDHQINSLNNQLKKLEKRVHMDSSNSSNPPSKDSDQAKAKRRTKSLRKKSDKKAGGQPGHKGETVKMSAHPDVVDVDIPKVCPHCGHPIEESSVQKVSKQLFQLRMKKLITEYVRGSAVCSNCGYTVQTEFPKNIVNPVNYDASLSVMTTYLANYGMMSIQRMKEYLSEFFHFPISWGTLSEYTKKMGRKLMPYKEAIKKAIFRYDIWHVDETGIYVNGKRMWLHTIVAGPYHLLFVHEKRGLEAIKEIGILEKFRGKLVHDNWISYQEITTCDHIQCMVHVERTLVAIYEEFQEEECKSLLDYIRNIYIQREEALSEGKKVFEDGVAQKIEKEIRELLNNWRQKHLEKYPAKENKHQRGRPKRDEAIKMLDRLMDPETSEQYFEWIHDFSIPYTNNRAEASFRLQKVKMKVSGTYRSKEGAQASCDHLAFIQTIRELGLDVREQLERVMNGQLSLQIFEA